MKKHPTLSRTAAFWSVQGWLIAGLVVAAASLAGCGGGGGGGGGASSIADFGNTFLGFEPSQGYAANAERVSLNLFPDSASQNQPSGSFDASTSALRLFNPADVAPPSAAVSGTFSGTTFVINMTSPPPPIVGSYSGHFSEADTIVLTGGGTTLTLRRDGGTFTADVATSTWTGSDASGAPWVVQLDFAPGYDNTEPTFLIQGSEQLNGATSQITGYVSNRYIEFHIARGTGEVVLTGQFPISSGTVNGDLMEFDAGGSLMRSGAAAFSLRSEPNPALFVAHGLGQRQTRISNVTGPDAWVWEYAASPDRTRVAYTASASRDDLPQVFLYTLASGSRVQLTGFGAGSEYSPPVWSADSSALAFVTPATLGAVPTLYVEKVDSNAPIPVSSARSRLGTYAWSPDSTQIAYLADQDTLNQVELYVVGADGSGWRKLSGSVLNPAERVVDWRWAPHGGTIVIRGDGTTPGVFELYSVSPSLPGKPWPSSRPQSGGPARNSAGGTGR